MLGWPKPTSISKRKYVGCICKQSKNTQHFYICEYLNEKEPEKEYQKILVANLKDIIYVLHRFKERKENFTMGS